MEPRGAAQLWALVAETDTCASKWRHIETGDEWNGGFRGHYKDVPFGSGDYLFANTGLLVAGTVHGDLDRLVFSGHGVMEWPDGTRYVGDLSESTFHGMNGSFTWSNGDVYVGAWIDGKRHGPGILTSMQAEMVTMNARGNGFFAHSMRYAGEWMHDLMEGSGEIEYFDAHDNLLRRFKGVFRGGLPRVGRLETPYECFDEVTFDGGTDAGSFANWYWAPSPSAFSRGGVLVDLNPMGEEYRAASSRFMASMPPTGIKIDKIQRVQNDSLRSIYNLQLEAIKKKGGLKAAVRTGNAACEAAPWESIVEEGFQSTLAGTHNGKVYGAGIYFAKNASLAHKYAVNTMRSSQRSKPPAAGAAGQQDGDSGQQEPLRMFLSCIVTGLYTVGWPGMNIAPLDPRGARGEHFHSLVDNTTEPQIFVINDNTRAYPGYLITYADASLQGRELPRIPASAPAAGAAGAPGSKRKRAANTSTQGAHARKPRAAVSLPGVL